MDSCTSIQFIKNQTEEICKYSIIQLPGTIKYIRKPTKELCILAIELSSNAINYINKNKFPEAHEYWRLLYG